MKPKPSYHCDNCKCDRRKQCYCMRKGTVPPKSIVIKKK